MGNIQQMNIETLDLNLLRIFHMLAQERSVTRAAERLKLSQPAVSNALRRMRAAFGDTLFVRGQGGMVPTPRAEELALAVAEALQRVEGALLGASGIDPRQLTEPITLICADAEITRHGPDILRTLEAAGCTVPLQFIPINTEYRADILWRNRQALTLTTMIHAPDGLMQRKVFDEHLVVLARADHPAAPAMDLEAYLAAEHLLIAPLGGAPEGYLDTWLRGQGLSRRIRMISHSFGSASPLVLETGLIATLPSKKAARQPYGDALRVLPLPIDAPPFSLHIFWSERYDDDPVNRWLRQTVHSAMHRPPG